MGRRGVPARVQGARRSVPGDVLMNVRRRAASRLLLRLLSSSELARFPG